MSEHIITQLGWTTVGVVGCNNRVRLHSVGLCHQAGLEERQIISPDPYG